MLDPQARALIDLMIARQVPPVHTQSPEEARLGYLERCAATRPAVPPVAQVQALAADSPNGPIALRLYRPFGADAAALLPALVYFHGGGWVIGDLDTHDVACRQLANAAGVAVVAVDYRLAPEHRFPAAVIDCVAATRWVRDHAATLQVDGSRLAVGGDSAGGNLAAVVCLALRDGGDPPPALQLLIYPATDMRALAPSYDINGEGYLLTAESMAYFRRQYIPDAALYTDWRASPLLAESLADLPPALVLTAGFDPLRDEGRQFADALSAAGNVAHYVCFERQVHGFFLMGGAIHEAAAALDLCAGALRRALL